MTAHGRVTQWDISTGAAAQMHPVTAASPRYDDRITTILLEDFEHICRSEHSHLHSTASLYLPIEAVVFVAHQHSNWSPGLLCLGKGHRNPRRISAVFH